MTTPDTCAGCAKVIEPAQDDRVLPVRIGACDFHDYLCVATWATARDAEHKAAIETQLRSTVDQLAVTAASEDEQEAASAIAVLPDACQALSDFTGQPVPNPVSA